MAARHVLGEDAQDFLDGLRQAREVCALFFLAIDNVADELKRLGVPQA